MCALCGHALLSHYSWTAEGRVGVACRACMASDAVPERGPALHAFAPPKDYSVTSDGRKPVLVLTTSLRDR